MSNGGNGGGFNYKLLGAAICSVGGFVIALIVITGSTTRYSADDKKAAWAALTSILTFWLGVGAAS
jgi:hypothetical protein